jgi:hypothetical protein
MGKHVEVAYFESNISKDLLAVADNKHLLDRDFFKNLWARTKPPRRRKGRRLGGLIPRVANPEIANPPPQ